MSQANVFQVDHPLGGKTCRPSCRPDCSSSSFDDATCGAELCADRFLRLALSTHATPLSRRLNEKTGRPGGRVWEQLPVVVYSFHSALS